GTSVSLFPALYLTCQAYPADLSPVHGRNLQFDSKRYQLPFLVPADERVIRRLGDVARQSVFLRAGERLHQMPAGKVRATDVADLAGAHAIVERAQRFLDGRERVEAVQLVEIDVVGAEAL